LVGRLCSTDWRSLCNDSTDMEDSNCCESKFQQSRSSDCYPRVLNPLTRRVRRSDSTYKTPSFLHFKIETVYSCFAKRFIPLLLLHSAFPRQTYSGHLGAERKACPFPRRRLQTTSPRLYRLRGNISVVPSRRHAPETLLCGTRDPLCAIR
jgi:hypothetical protein